MNWPGPGRRLYVRLYLAFLAVLVAVAVLSTALASLIAPPPVGLLREGPRLAQRLANDLPSLDEPLALGGALEAIHQRFDLDASVVDLTGRTLGRAGEPFDGFRAVGAMRQRRRASWMISQGIVGAPVRGSYDVFLLLHVPQQHTLWLERRIAWIVGALLVSSLLVLPLSRSITRPLEQLAETAEAFGQGDLTARSRIAGSDEVGRLARAFDTMAERIQAARKAEKELLANVSHELRTPLARVRVALELIPAGEAAVQKRLQAVGEELDELEGLIADVLTTSKLELAAQPLERGPVALASLLERSRSRAQTLDARQAIQLEVDPGLEVLANEPLLARTLDNLFDNARKYGASDVHPVRVTAREEGFWAFVVVADRGPGFPPEDLAHVFDPFYRGSAARGSRSGYGLGLSLARRVAEAHGGAIQASNDPAGGARIELRLPRAGPTPRPT